METGATSAAHLSPDSSSAGLEPAAKRAAVHVLSDSDCLLCRCEPVNPCITKCGHIFCYSCVARSLEFSMQCPRCLKLIGDMSDVKPYGATNRDDPEVGHDSDDSSAEDQAGKFDTDKWLQKNIAALPSIETEQLKSFQREVTEVILLRNPKPRTLGHAGSLHFLERVQRETKEVNTASMAQLEAAECDMAKLKDHLTSKRASQAEGDSVNCTVLPKEACKVVKASVGRHYEDLSSLYFTLKVKPKYLDSKVNDSGEAISHYDNFTMAMGTVTEPRQFKVLRSFELCDMSYTPNSVYSIAFDSSQTLMAVASTSGGVKVYDYDKVLSEPEHLNTLARVYPPNQEAVHSVSWSMLETNYLGYCDQGGSLWVWDALAEKMLRRYSEHKTDAAKRGQFSSMMMRQPLCRCTFSLHYARTCFSCSADGTVRIWDTNMAKSAHVYRSGVPFSDIQVHPTRPLQFAVSHDDVVLMYDTRWLDRPEHILRMDARISQFRFLGPNEVAAVAVDGSVTHCNIKTDQLLCNYATAGGSSGSGGSSGGGGLGCTPAHYGLCTAYGLQHRSNSGPNRFIFCGAENKTVNCYCKHLQQPLFQYDLQPTKISAVRTRATAYASAMACKPVEQGSSLDVAVGTGQGEIKLMRLEPATFAE